MTEESAVYEKIGKVWSQRQRGTHVLAVLLCIPKAGGHSFVQRVMGNLFFASTLLKRSSCFTHRTGEKNILNRSLVNFRWSWSVMATEELVWSIHIAAMITHILKMTLRKGQRFGHSQFKICLRSWVGFARRLPWPRLFLKLGQKRKGR